MKITNKMKEASVDYLEKYMSKKRKNILSAKHLSEINNLITQKRKQNTKLATEILNSPLCKIAIADVIRDGKENIVKYRNHNTYTLNANKVVKRIFDLAVILNKGKNKKFYREYLNG